MADYTLYYWPLPFRGEFVKIVLAHAGASCEEASTTDLQTQMRAAPRDQFIPHIGPPVLTDHSAGVSISQTQAILIYLGRKHDLIPADPLLEALTSKLIADANDVLYEMTLYNGAQMWTQDTWNDYQPRLARWMRVFEELGRRHGLSPAKGNMLGTDELGIADLVTYALWGVMTVKLPVLRPLFEETSPAIAALCDRIANRPEQERVRKQSDADYGEEWCSGEIEASLRLALGLPKAKNPFM
ncbi:MAG: glutathione S-transferase [Pseudomonadota bacterium]